MRLFRWLAAAAFALPVLPSAGAQEGDAAKAPAELLQITEEDGQYVSFYQSKLPKGTRLKVIVRRQTMAGIWAMWTVKSGGKDVEVISAQFSPASDVVEEKVITVERNGSCSFAFKPRHPALFVLEVTYDPYIQQKVDPKLKEILRFRHALIAFQEADAAAVLAGEASDFVAFMKEYFDALRDAMKRSHSETELSKAMASYLEQAKGRMTSTWHYGVYSMMTELSAFSNTRPPKPDEPEGLAIYVPDRIDAKSPNLPFSALRESLLIAVGLARECVLEAQRVGRIGDPEKVGDRGRLVRSCARSLAPALPAVTKVDTTGRVAPLVGKAKLRQLFGETTALVDDLVENNKDDEKAVKALLERLDAASSLIADAKLSLAP